jgi:hypothetical protein
MEDISSKINVNKKNFIFLFSIQCSPISARALLFGRFPDFRGLSFLYEQHADCGEYGALVE